LRRAVGKPLARPSVQFLGDAIAVALSDPRLAVSLRQVLPEQAIGVFVAPHETSRLVVDSRNPRCSGPACQIAASR